MSGRALFKTRKQLRAYDPTNPEASPQTVVNPFAACATSYKTTEICITSELATMAPSHCRNGSKTSGSLESDGRNLNHHGYSQYSVLIERGNTPFAPQSELIQPSSSAEVTQQQSRSIMVNIAAKEANDIAWGYTKCACLFFISLLITWTPASLNRVYSLTHPNEINWGYTYAAGLVLPLMGWWNFVIYVTTSWDAVCALFAPCLGRGRMRHSQGTIADEIAGRNSRGNREKRSSGALRVENISSQNGDIKRPWVGARKSIGSLSESLKALAG
jgi:hypothetical protein